MNYDCTKVFDGSTSTYFDGLGHGWVQADLGEKYNLSAIGYCPRSGYEYRCLDGKFMVSDDGENWTDVYTISSQPSFGMNYVTKFDGEVSGRYVRYQVPDGTPSHGKDSTYCCNIAEISLYGEPASTVTYENKISPVKVTGSEPYKNSENDCNKAFDADNSTFFDGVGNGWVEADLGGIYDVQAISYCPRKGHEYRCLDGKFSYSLDGENWSQLFTIDTVPSFKTNFMSLEATGTLKARYIRYEVPEGAPQNDKNHDDVYCCNIAEIGIYGELDSLIGDVNNDSKLGAADIVELEKFLLGYGKLGKWQNADLNADERVDAFDMVLMRKLLLERR